MGLESKEWELEEKPGIKTRKDAVVNRIRSEARE
jgi:hypothetical protein